MADDVSVVSGDVVRQEHSELLNKIAELQQTNWMLEEKVRCFSTFFSLSGDRAMTSLYLRPRYQSVPFTLKTV